MRKSTVACCWVMKNVRSRLLLVYDEDELAMESKGGRVGGSRGESGLLSWSWSSDKLMRVSQCGQEG